MRFTLILLFSITLNFSFGQVIENIPLSIGEDAPNFKGKNQNGEKISSKKLIQEGSVVIVFYRGEWCGYCKRHLSNLQDSLNLIHEEGASVVVVTPEQPKYIQKTIKKTKATYSIISDVDYSIMEAYNVKYDIIDTTTTKYKGYVENVTSKQNNNGENVLPIPATYIIGQDGKIKWYHFDPKYSNRSTVKDILSL